MNSKRAWIIRKEAVTKFDKVRFFVALESTLMPGHFDMAHGWWNSRAAAKKAIESNRMGVFQIVAEQPADLQPVTQAVRDDYRRRSHMRRDAICAFSTDPRSIALKEHLDALDEECSEA